MLFKFFSKEYLEKNLPCFQLKNLFMVYFSQVISANFQREKEPALLVAVRLHRCNIINYILQQEDFDLSKGPITHHLRLINANFFLNFC